MADRLCSRPRLPSFNPCVVGSNPTGPTLSPCRWLRLKRLTDCARGQDSSLLIRESWVRIPPGPLPLVPLPSAHTADQIVGRSCSVTVILPNFFLTIETIRTRSCALRNGSYGLLPSVRLFWPPPKGLFLARTYTISNPRHANYWLQK